MNEFVRKMGFLQRPATADEVPPELAQALDESVEDLLHDRTEDTGDFLDRMQAKVDAAIARDADVQGPKR